jgi:DNA polymerase III subunit beta
MKFTVSQKPLSECLALVSKAIPSRPSHPVLTNFLIETDKELQTIAITGFDLSLGIRAELSAEIEEEGSIALPAKLLGDIISKLPEGTITFDLSDTQVKLIALSGTYHINGMHTDEYPEFPMIEDSGNTIELSSKAIAFGLDQTRFCVSSDEAKQVLTGVNISPKSDGLTFAATDGHRLSVVETSTDDSVELPDFAPITIPGKALSEVQRAIARIENVRCEFDRDNARFEIGDTVIYTRILQGSYPNYPQLIPKQFTREATIDRRSLVASLERISILADQKNSIVKLEITSDRLIISCDAADVGSGREELKIEMDGEELAIAFNAKYLLEGLKAIGSEDVLLKCNSATLPAIVVPCGDERSVYLIMPVQIRS